MRTLTMYVVSAAVLSAGLWALEPFWYRFSSSCRWGCSALSGSRATPDLVEEMGSPGNMREGEAGNGQGRALDGFCPETATQVTAGCLLPSCTPG